jgi:hypothetical protein
VEVAPECLAEEGVVVVGRALGERRDYGTLELPNGRMAKVVAGNLVAGVLGARQALHGHMGVVPEKIAVGDRLALLNIGGVIGHCPSPNRALGPPIPVEILGHVVRKGAPVNIKDYTLERRETIPAEGTPLVLILGTCMNSGKTTAACEVIRLLSNAGVRIAAAKLAGVAALKDTIGMEDNGAVATASFLDCGLPSTVLTPDLAPIACSVIAHIEQSKPDLIVLELGDGIIGGYNSGSILEDPSVRARTACRVLCANDLVGAWGGVQFLEKRGHKPDIFSGVVTDNAVGTGYIETQLGIPCANSFNEPVKLARLVAEKVGIAVDLPNR